MRDPKLYISSDYAFNRPEVLDQGEDVVPVDANWGSVPVNKDDGQNLENAQASIRSRFSLGR